MIGIGHRPSHAAHQPEGDVDHPPKGPHSFGCDALISAIARTNSKPDSKIAFKTCAGARRVSATRRSAQLAMLADLRRSDDRLSVAKRLFSQAFHSLHGCVSKDDSVLLRVG